LNPEHHNGRFASNNIQSDPKRVEVEVETIQAQDPEHYLKPITDTPPPDVASGVIYTCSMHPQIREKHPGACPIFGMALEPFSTGAETGDNAELRDIRADHASHIVGGLNFLYPRLAFNRQPQPEHVHVDHTERRHSLHL
jgi:hypothetical protein